MGTTFRTNFATYYTARQVILNAIATKASTLAQWSNIVGQANAPASNATANIVTSGVLASRPTGANGDFYFATDNNTLYQKTAGAWVASATVGANIGTNVTGQITSANIASFIAANAIAAAYIASLNADVITTGTLNVARLAAQSINTDKLIVGSASVAASGSLNYSALTPVSTDTYSSITTGTVCTLVSTGAPVTVTMAIRSDIGPSNYYVGACRIKHTLYRNGVIVAAGFAGSHDFMRLSSATGTPIHQHSTSILHREAFPAGTHLFTVVSEFWGLSAALAATSWGASSTLATYITTVASENKV